jgi:trigger factor
VKSTVENLSPTRVRLAVEVPFDELKPGLDAAYKQIASSVRVPGFRPGKVPPRVIDQRVGRGAVLNEAINSALPNLYSEAAREHELRPLGQPEVEVTNLADGESVSFTAEVDVRPEISLPELDNLAVTVDDVTVTDADVDEQLDALRTRFGTLTGVDRPVRAGDYVSLDLAAAVDGQAIEAGSAQGMSYEVGSGNLLDGLDEALAGKSAGESASFATTLRQGDHAGTEAEVTATVNSVKEQELPDVDDEFAQLASEFDTVDELRGDLRERLGRTKTFEQGGQARDRLIDHLLETVQFPVPDSAIESEVETREHEVVHSLGHDDAAFDRYLSMLGQSREEFTEKLRENAQQSVRTQLLLDAVADKIEVQVADAELTEYLIRQAAQYNMPPQEFANQIVQAGNLPVLMADVRRNKALATLLEQANVTDESGNTVDLNALMATEDTEATEAAADSDQDVDADAEGGEAAAGDAASDTDESVTP